MVHVVSQTPQEVVAYWTPERLRDAAPIEFPSGRARPIIEAPPPSPSAPPLLVAPSPPTAGSGSGGGSSYAAGTDVESSPGADGAFPQRIHGKIFATLAGIGDFSCSGTVVTSPLKNLIVTAGHCVYGAGKNNQYATNFVFVPAYRNGVGPLGIWPAVKLFVPPGWVNFQGLYGYSHDVGMVQLSGQIQDTLGARGIGFHLNPGRFHIYGYPASPNASEGGDYDGQRLVRCDSAYAGMEATGTPPAIVASPCYMEQGSSGGGWVTGGGVVNSVVSHSYCDHDASYCGKIHGPYFGAEAQALYEASIAGEPARKCKRSRKGSKSRKSKARSAKKCKKKKRKR